MTAKKGFLALILAATLACAAPTATGRPPSVPPTISPTVFQPVVVPTIEPTPSVGITPQPTVKATPKPTPKPIPQPPKPHKGPSVAEAKAYALARLGATQYACLADIVKHEDGTWDPYRTNPSSGSYGIPQALPGSKMRSAGADWRWNRITQVKWMIGYVNRRYGSACEAAAFRDQMGWY